MSTHELREWSPLFGATWEGVKTFMVTKNERYFQVGNSIALIEWDPETRQPSGRRIETIITYVQPAGEFGIVPGYCVIGFCREMKRIGG